MRVLFNTLIILALAGLAGAQTWPSGAISDPDAGLPCPPAGTLSLRVSSAMLSNEVWTDNRSKFSICMALGRGLGISAASSFRDLSGHGAYQRGIEDMRVGLSYWPKLVPGLSTGVNGFFAIPTGYRTQESYYDEAGNTTRTLPAFSLEQTAGELYTGAAWSLAPAAEVSAFAGYFSTSDKVQQAFRWGLGAAVAPFGPRVTAEFGYGQSLTRTGDFPTTETFAAALVLKVVRGFSLAPGVWADLSDDPLYGASLGLRLCTPVARMTTGKDNVTAPASPLPRLGGTVLVPPPTSARDLADGNELWQCIQGSLVETFDQVSALPTLDVPGVPFNDESEESTQRSVRALASAHPEADWVLISRVEREDVSRGRGLKIPLLWEQPAWTAQCRLRVRLINLRSGETHFQDTVEARTTHRGEARLTAVAAADKEVLSMSASRELTFEVYREAGRVIARELSYAP
ncbi:MAG: hypothetical protein NT025_05545 [bacterium]|nr:hypothetical protein [bacterium]